MTTDSTNDAEILYSYTRAEALADGTLVDVSIEGREVGITVPVALTSALFETIIAIPKDSGQDQRGRTHDVLFMAACAARRARDSSEPRVEFKLLMTTQENRLATLTLLVDIGPGDLSEPVITIGYPEDF
jgi:hypothetical protein